MAEAADDFSQYPAQRGRGRRATDRQRINWSAVAIVVSVILWVLGAASGLFGDYRKIGDRVTTLETQRQEDIRRENADRIENTRRFERMEDKLDRILDRVK